MPTPTNIQIPRRYDAIVKTKEQVTPTAIRLRLQPKSPIPFTPGQYASFLIGDKRRPFSFASLPTDPELEFIISTAPGGVGSTYAQALQVGDTVAFLSPYGRFVLQPESPRPLIFIATGTGIAPVRVLILQALQTTTPPVSLTLFFGNYNERYSIFNEEFIHLSHIQPGFIYVPILSDPTTQWLGAKGWVTQVVPRQITNVPDFDFYICGNPDMVKDMSAVLEQAKVPSTQIYREAFI